MVENLADDVVSGNDFMNASSNAKNCIGSPTEQVEDDFGWSWEDDADSVVTTSLVDTLPPQLHPAVSLGLQRVSSCAYFSLQGSVSEADLHSISSGEIVGDEHHATHADLLYHDIIMHVFTFLDAKSLAAFSETARRCNFECFYFLQLQLQRALLKDNLNSSLHGHAGDNSDDRLAAIAGSYAISRLASIEKQEAQDVVQEYLDSNCTLRTMPLSHSLAYIRQVLRRNGFPGGPSSANQPNQAFTTSAAVLIGLVGAATVMSGNVDVEVFESFGTELPNMLFKVGFVGSLMGAARHGWDSQNKTRQQEGTANSRNGHQQFTMRETAEQMARMVQEMVQQVRMAPLSPDADDEHKSSEQSQDGFFSRRMYDAFLAASGRPVSSEHDASSNKSQPYGILDGPWSPNPYEHLPQRVEEEEESVGEKKVDDSHASWNPSVMGNHMLGLRAPNPPDKSMAIPPAKMPSGCVGAYFRAIHRASKSITRLVKQQRRARFESLPNKEQVAASFIDACCSDESLDVVKNLVQVRGVIDAEGFYCGSDGLESCALHASAFHGATQVLEFLCGGIDDLDYSKDQGLCNVDLQDVNGWTALHFAAGANCVESARILANRGANLSVVAENGYTPLQWAQRLCNHEVAEELRMRLEDADPYHSSNHRWIAGASQPLSMIAHRFFAMIPTN